MQKPTLDAQQGLSEPRTQRVLSEPRTQRVFERSKRSKALRHNRLLRFAACAALMSCTLLFAGNVTGRGGFEAVAQSPDGKLIAVGGQNRVIYVVDAETFDVKQRLYHGKRIGRLAFDKDAKHLLVEDEDNVVSLMDRTTGKVLAKRDYSSGMIVHSASGRVIVKDEKDFLKPSLRWLNPADLKEQGGVALVDNPVACLLDPEGKRLLVLGRSKLADRPRLPPRDTPRELRGLERAIFQFRHDGYESDLLDVEVPSGKISRSRRLWYTSDSDSTVLARAGDTVYVFNRVNLCAKIPEKGEITVFETSQRINYGLGVSLDGKRLALGTHNGGSIGPITGERTPFTLPSLGGQDEWVTHFVVQEDGTTIAVTTAYRLVRIDKEGRIEKIKAIY